jgi:predicted dehydrogenase
MEKARLAFVGCGAITRNSHLPAGLRSPLVEVHALVDSEVENADALARMYGLDTRVAGQVADVIDDADGFVVATPNDTHYPIAREILERGKPVLIEKPITTSHEDALELCRLAEAKRTFISVGYVYRFFPGVRLLKGLLDEGYFGPVVGFRCEMGSAGGWAPVSGYNLDRSRSGGGVLVINGSHFVDLVMHCFGEPASYRYADDNYGNVEANCKGVFTFDGDGGAFEGTFFFSKTINLRNHFVIDTESRSVEWAPARPDRLTVIEKGRPGVRIELSSSDAATPDCFRAQIEEFARNTRQLEGVTSDGWNGATSIKLINDMYSHSTRLAEDWLAYKE